jgi:flagellar hook-associated protein 3 FlgL
MIGRITEQMTQQMTLADLQVSQDRLDTTQQQLSSGKRINQPSDDPYGTSLSLQLQGQLSDLNAYSSNVTDGTSWTQSTLGSLTNITNMMQRVSELVVEAGNGSLSQADLTSSAAEVSQLIEAVKQEANTTYDGQYLFSGTATSTAPYQSGSTDTYQGNTSTINRLIGPGTTIQVNTDISQLLGNGQASGDGKLLDVMRNIVSDMQSGNTSGLQTDSQALSTNLNTAEQMQASVGAVANRLQLASSRIQDTQTNTSAALSSVQDADMATTITNYSTEQAAYSAALRASASIVQESLLNFLQ